MRRGEDAKMTLDEAIDIIFDEAKRHGTPLTRELSRHIAQRLFQHPISITLKPGEIAQKYRERYEEG